MVPNNPYSMSSQESGKLALLSKLQLNFAIAISYFLLGLFSQIVTIPDNSTAAIWPSAGIALASVILYGYSALPGIFLGSFSICAWVFNFNFEFFEVYFFTALGASAAALVGHTLIQHYLDSSIRLVKVRDIIKFLLLAGPLSSLISTTASLAVLYTADKISQSELPLHWLVMWSGNAIGVIIFTPALLTLFAHPKELWQQRRVSVALPALVVFLFFTLFYSFATKLAFSEAIDLSKQTLFDNMDGVYASILLCGLCFAFVFVVQLLVLSGRNLRKDKITVEKTAHLLNEINNRKKVERELSIAKQKAESSNQAKSQFLSQISHELRTPLNGILGFTRLLQKNPTFNGEDKKQLNIIQNCANHLLELINDILDISKIESGKVEIVSEPFDFKCFLYDLMGIFKLKADDNNISFEVVYENIPDCVDSDEKRLRQIFSNLISNAINFTNQGGVVVTINHKNNQLHLVVTDTGCGIAEQDHEKIFEPFIQVTTPIFVENGSGLGLTITRQLVKLLGGSIAFKSELNLGSKFFTLIPLKTCAPKKLAEHLEKRHIIGYKGIKKSIWVVDDNKENASLLQILLQELGFEVKILSDGLQCLEWLEQSSPDLIFMDKMLPGISGIETNHKILKKIPGQKIIGMSASVLTHEKQSFLDSGCITFINKPFQQEEMMSSLSLALNLSWKYYSEMESSNQLSSVASDTILIADDVEINCLLLENQLINLNYRVDIARDGGQALDMMMSRPYKFALIDLQMPVLNGIEVIKQVRSQSGPNQKTKIIAVSASPKKDKAPSVLNNGFDAYLSKPVELQELENLLRKNT
jgi:signal transduction histidine kinase/CheY-like chemotaxis protein